MNIKIDVNVNVSFSRETLETISDFFLGKTEPRFSTPPVVTLHPVNNGEQTATVNEPVVTEEKTRKPRAKKEDKQAEAEQVAGSAATVITEEKPTEQKAGETAEDRKLARRMRVKELREKHKDYEKRIIDIVATYKVTNLNDIPDESHSEFMDRINAIRL